MVRGPVGTVCILLLSNHAGVSDCFMIRQNVAILGNRSSDETPAYNDQGCTWSCIEWWSPKIHSSFHKNRCIYRYKIWISESTRIAIVGILAGLIHWYPWGTSMNLQLSARKTTTMTTATTTTTTSMERVGVKRSSRARKENTVEKLWFEHDAYVPKSLWRKHHPDEKFETQLWMGESIDGTFTNRAWGRAIAHDHTRIWQ